MESLTRLVSESLIRHGLDRPVDYRRLRWSRWFRCDSHHSVLQVPSQPGVFALAEEITSFDLTSTRPGTDAFVRSAQGSEALVSKAFVEERRYSAVSNPQTNPALAAVGSGTPEAGSRKPEAAPAHRMLAVTQFFEDEDMAFVLDRMLTRPTHPMRALFATGRYFVRFVVIEDRFQRRSIYNALNQWLTDSAEKASGIGSHFAASLELTAATEYTPPTGSNRT